jgi:hypothetical protein
MGGGSVVPVVPSVSAGASAPAQGAANQKSSNPYFSTR